MMEWLELALSLLALVAVGYLFYAKPWKAECDAVLHQAKRFAADGDKSVLLEVEHMLPKSEPKPTRTASPEKPKTRPRTWAATRDKLENEVLTGEQK